jgi:Fe-S-cluster formation regulator IscX/YfhJ
MIQKQEKKFNKIEKDFSDNPFEPKMRPRLVNFVKETNEYKVIVDLKPLDGDENAVNLDIKDNIISISGKLNKKSNSGEKMLNFAQSYYVDEKLDQSKLTKEKKGDRYIITIPLEQNSNN